MGERDSGVEHRLSGEGRAFVALRGLWLTCLMGAQISACASTMFAVERNPLQADTMKYLQEGDRLSCRVLGADDIPKSMEMSCLEMFAHETTAVPGDRVRVKPLCGDAVELPVRLGRRYDSRDRPHKAPAIDLELPWRAPRDAPRMYYSGQVPAIRLLQFVRDPESDPVTMERAHSDTLRSWRRFIYNYRLHESIETRENTVMRHIADIPDSSGACTLALVVPELDGNFPKELADGHLLVVPKRELAEQPHGEGLTVEEQLAREREADLEQQRQKAQAQQRRDQEISDQEVLDGNCTDHRRSELMSMLEGLESMLRAARMRTAGYEMAVATPDGSSITFRSGFPGRYHLLIAGYSPLTVALGTDGRPSRPSRYETLLSSNGWTSASVLLDANINDQVNVTVKGAGCFVMASFWE